MKNEIRKQIKKLTVQNASNLEAESNIICQKIISSPQYKNAKIIMAYMALSDEVDLSLVIQNALTNGKEVYLPHIADESPSNDETSKNINSQMLFYSFTSDTKITTGKYGIKEPQFSNDSKLFIPTKENLAQNILILTPGRAFTLEGKRLGRGKGYYDYFFELIKETPTVIKAGVSFSFQILQDLPTTPNDVDMEIIFTSAK